MSLENIAITDVVEGGGGELGAGEVAVLEAMMSGGTVAGAARAAGVGRTTVYLWLAEGKPLRAALDRWKRDLAETARNRLLLLTNGATVAVAEAIKRGDARIAMRLLEKMGVMAAPAVGPTGYELQQREKWMRLEAGEKKIRRETSVELFLGDWESLGLKKE